MVFQDDLPSISASRLRATGAITADMARTTIAGVEVVLDLVKFANRKLAAILVSDVVGYSRLAGADEDRILARLRALRSDLIDPTIAVHHGRVVKRTGRRPHCRVPQRRRRGELRH